MKGVTLERPNTVSGLVEKRGELAKQLKPLRAEEKETLCDLEHVDVAIRLFELTADTDRIVRYPTMQRAKKGEVVRLIVRSLRAIGHPLTALDLVHIPIKERELRADDATDVIMRKRLGVCLTKLRADGYFRNLQVTEHYKLRELAR